MPFVGSEWFWQTGPRWFHNDRPSTAADYDWGPDFGDLQRHFINDIEYDIGDSFSDAQVQESKPPSKSKPSTSSTMSSYLGKRFYSVMANDPRFRARVLGSLQGRHRYFFRARRYPFNVRKRKIFFRNPLGQRLYQRRRRRRRR